MPTAAPASQLGPYRTARQQEAGDQHSEDEVDGHARQSGGGGQVEQAVVGPVGQRSSPVGLLVGSVDGPGEGDPVTLRSDTAQRVLLDDTGRHPPFVDAVYASGLALVEGLGHVGTHSRDQGHTDHRYPDQGAYDRRPDSTGGQ